MKNSTSNRISGTKTNSSVIKIYFIKFKNVPVDIETL